MTTTEEPVRSQSPELAAMTLPKLKTVATQLGVDGATKMKKGALVDAIADLQAKNRDAAKAEREARREARNSRKKESKPAANNSQDLDDGSNDEAPSSNNDRVTAMTALTATIAMTVPAAVIPVTVIPVTVHHVKSANRY